MADTLKSVSTPDVHGQPVINPDGTNIGSSSDSSLQKISATLRFATNNIDEASETLIYIGKEDKDGAYLIKKIDTSSGTVITFATIVNNVAVTTYASAWSSRASLSYTNFAAVM